MFLKQPNGKTPVAPKRGSPDMLLQLVGTGIVIDDDLHAVRYTQQKAFETVEIMLEFIKRSLENCEDVLISSFGKFCVKKSKTERSESGYKRGPDD